MNSINLTINYRIVLFQQWPNNINYFQVPKLSSSFINLFLIYDKGQQVWFASPQLHAGLDKLCARQQHHAGCVPGDGHGHVQDHEGGVEVWAVEEVRGGKGEEWGGEEEWGREEEWWGEGEADGKEGEAVHSGPECPWRVLSGMYFFEAYITF